MIYFDTIINKLRDNIIVQKKPLQIKGNYVRILFGLERGKPQRKPKSMSIRSDQTIGKITKRSGCVLTIQSFNHEKYTIWIIYLNSSDRSELGELFKVL